MGNAGRSGSVRRLATSAFVVAGIGGILIACAGDSSDPTSQSPATNDVTNGGTSVGPAGGTVTENGVTVTIPAGALAASTPIHITESTVVPNGYTVSGKVYHFEPSGTHFSAPITITLPSTKPEIVYWTVDGSETEFEPVETDFDEAGGKASVQITHFSGGFVGTTPNGITCVVKQPSGCPGTKTTIESPAFWYTNTRYWSGAYYPYRSYIATNSIGVNRYMNSHAGEGVLEPNADRSIWKTNVGSLGDPGTAYVSQDIITKFTAQAARGGVSAGSSCGLGNGSVHAPLVDYTCSGGNVRIGDGPPRPVPDAGVSIDSGISTDASSGGDSAATDAASNSDASYPEDTGASMSEDSGTSTPEDSGVGETDSGIADSGLVESGAADAGAGDSGVADAGVSGVVCKTIRRAGYCPGAPTYETPKFWFVRVNTDDRGGIATDSPGLKSFFNTGVWGSPVAYATDSTHTKYRYSNGFLVTATVQDRKLVSFFADCARGGVDPPMCPETHEWTALIDVECSGGNVWIDTYAPPAPR